jgi:hypothetical protein
MGQFKGGRASVIDDERSKRPSILTCVQVKDQV